MPVFLTLDLYKSWMGWSSVLIIHSEDLIDCWSLVLCGLVDEPNHTVMGKHSSSFGTWVVAGSITSAMGVLAIGRFRSFPKLTICSRVCSKPLFQEMRIARKLGGKNNSLRISGQLMQISVRTWSQTFLLHHL